MKTNKQMLEDDSLISKAIETSSGGQMSAEQLDTFIDTVVEQSEILMEMDVITGIESSEYQMDTLGLASRIMAKGVEGTAPSVTDATIGRRTLNPTEVIIAFDITKRFLMRNIARDNADAQINALFAKQYKNDLVDLIFNGDKDSGNAFIQIIDGYIDRAKADADTHKDDTVSSNDSMLDIFDAMIDALPNKWLNEEELFFVVSPKNQKRYQRELKARATSLGDAMIVGKPETYHEGIKIMKAAAFPDAEFLLTPRKNLTVGIGQEMNVDYFWNARKRVREYTTTGYVDANYKISDAVVLFTEQ